ncbi:MAG: four helix bundle protein [Clostridia bacterium]
MKENKLADLSMDFSVQVIKLCERIKGHYSLVNQLERSATSIGANIHEANYAHGRPDFIAKLQITLKECYETEYWIELFVKSGIADRETVESLYNQCGTIRRILISSLNTAKGNEK